MNLELLKFDVGLQVKPKGIISFFEVSPSLGDSIQEELEERARKLDPLEQAGYLKKILTNEDAKLIFAMNNQALQNGVSIYEERGPISVSRIMAGTQVSPTASTFTTQQSLQSPLSNLNFPRIGSWEKTNITNGFRWTFAFRRPALSCGGIQATEMGIQVVNGQDVALINRVISPNSGLPHTFSATQDTIGVFDFQKTYS